MSERPGSASGLAVDTADAERMQAALSGDGLCIFPTDTVYGIGCNPDSETAVRRLYELKGRPPAKPAAVMFFSLQAALATLDELAGRERAALSALLPGGLTLLLENRTGRFPLACGPDPRTLGLRVPELGQRLAALGAIATPLMQSSANRSGAADARRIGEVPASLLRGVDVVVDAGELPGVPSTVLDLRGFARHGEWRIVREGAVSAERVERLLRLLA